MRASSPSAFVSARNNENRVHFPLRGRTGSLFLLRQYDYPDHGKDSPGNQVAEPENLAISLGSSGPKGIWDCPLHNLSSDVSIVREQRGSEQYEDNPECDGECTSHADDSAPYRSLPSEVYGGVGLLVLTPRTADQSVRLAHESHPYDFAEPR
jgi:hypothetical protein